MHMGVFEQKKLKLKMCYIPPRIHIRLTVTEEHTLCNKHIA